MTLANRVGTKNKVSTDCLSQSLSHDKHHVYRDKDEMVIAWLGGLS